MIEVNSSSGNRAELTTAIGLAIMQWQDATQAYDEAVGMRLGLNMAERHCIGLLHGGPQSAGAIATATGLTPAAVTALIDRLEARGLLTRTRSLEDRRKVVIEATESTRELSARYYGAIAREGEKLIATFSDAELATIRRFVTAALDLQRDQLMRLKAEAPQPR
ncbi:MULTISPECIES: MarR family transcriptional regulator [unclassified Mesorhizobium]|uniref:MarR family winged helix-turn-helix transcriptional regulator n=1 Tax=unclassified Mesorhizobium TaxID=325217 RepID=UPI000FD8B87E|nr:MULTISPECIES: MarR family transcriptional regulator [unclassified Mesorhizobium]TGR37288.1 MarR family transcriptional regulator [bacterium M00.F.Ca.ET.199.01.1.1]TGU21948.1 MarR family transcriptional regulator [bacterium M00.F.Ca.ET.156.01.1.1]TGV82609.1 MarR family transcriptional regulator [Mesorhizobium sp. M00.F.Ca.ET.149.01.1.1]TGQ81339.1 MarR family transcriptional regulator [Mesorhizobium sp. M8A.F.Ca.ET.207.01.1.1]TGQ88710.1 MarR family transcriptional regulator [Mesorhizobium sp.